MTSVVASAIPSVTNGGEDSYRGGPSPTKSTPDHKKQRRSVKLFSSNKPKNFTLTDVTNTPNSPSTISKPQPSPMTKQSKKQLALQVQQLEQELKLVKYKATTSAEQNEELKLKLAATSTPGSGMDAETLMEENKKLRAELDGYVTKKWRDFCAIQDSPTPLRKRAFYSREQE